RLAALDERLSAAEQAGGTVGELQAQLQEVAGQVEKLTAAFPELGRQITATVEELSAQVAALDEDQDALAGLVSNLQEQINAVQQQANSLDQRLNTTQESIENASTRRERAAALALAVGQLDSAIEQAESYEKPLQTVQALASGDQVVADASSSLQPMAEQGVPSTNQLRQEFDEVAGEIVHSTSDADGVLGQAASNLRRLVSVRAVGADVEGEGAEARVARAEARLEQGDLAGAVQELEGLEGAAAEAAAPWLEKARARVAAEQAVSQLQNHATGLLSQTQ
ncbi:MAG TPA: mitofilin family membrane protein, partial [Geminicoccaceae bacterium]